MRFLFLPPRGHRKDFSSQETKEPHGTRWLACAQNGTAKSRWAQRANPTHKPSDLGSVKGTIPLLTMQTVCLFPLSERGSDIKICTCCKCEEGSWVKPFCFGWVCARYFAGRLLLALVKKTSSQIRPLWSLKCCDVVGDGALIDFKQLSS